MLFSPNFIFFWENPLSDPKRLAPPFKADNGRFLTEALFWETNRDRTKFAPLFTLKETEHEGLPSLRAEYLRIGDPTEYRFATEVLGSLSHWKLLKSLDWFKPHAEEWAEALDSELRAEAATAARTILNSPDASDAARLQAAKFLSDRGWSKKATKGRPSKEEVVRFTKEEARLSKTYDEDYKRIMN
jgi:hypothetical protein